MANTEKLVKEIRDNLFLAKSVDKENREAYRDNAKFLNGDQWEPLEAQKRRDKRLMLTADQLNAPVDQIVNQVKQNKPGPAVSPSGEGTDKDDAEIFGGLLRRIDYENRAWIAFSSAMESATGCNFGCFEADIEYKNDRSFERKIIVRNIVDPNETVYFDPSAVEKDRSDSDWAIVARMYSKQKYKDTFGNTKLSKMGKISSLFDYFQSYVDQGMSGWVTKDDIQIVKYWKVEKTKDMLRLYNNNVAYFDSESYDIPSGTEVNEKIPAREVMRRNIRWYLTDGVDILDDGDWEGYWIPLFPVYGRERWIQGKRYITSMIQMAKQAQQAFNFAFTGACEVLALSTKAPWVGLLGQFKSKLSQWKTSNTNSQAYIEYDPVDLPNGQVHVSPPVRQLGEPPIQAFMAFCNLCINAIQRATSVFDPSLGKQKSDQSGRAIQELQQQSQEGNFHWSDNLNVALTHYYRVMLDLVQKEYDQAQVTQILRADGTPLQVQINQDFEAGQDDTGVPVKKHYKIAKGNFSVTVALGQSYDSQLLANESKITTLIKVLPPELIAQAADIFIKLQNYGPLGDQLAERLKPAQYRNQDDPQAAAAHLAQAMQQNQQLQAELQKLQWMIQTKQPELETRKQIALLQQIGNLEAVKLKIGDKSVDRQQALMIKAADLSHDAASDSAGRVHEMKMAQTGHDNDMEQQELQSQLEPEQEESGDDGE